MVLLAKSLINQLLKAQQQNRFLSLYRPIGARLSNYCRHLTNSAADAEDLLHDTIMATFEKMDQLKSDAAFPAFMYAAAYNIYCKQLRRRKFKGKYSETAAAFLKDAHASAELLTDLTIVFEKMKQLPAAQYEAMILFYVSDLPLEEIRNIQQTSLSAVKLRIRYGKEKLLKLLNEQQKQIVLTLF
jgi:RNA polymerase sigma-70 factor (ECF subfamily)